MITNNIITHVVCNDFRTLKKAVYQIDQSNDVLTSILLCEDADLSHNFAEYISKFVDKFALKAFRQGNKQYAYNLRYIKAMLCMGETAALHGFVGIVSKKTIFEAINSIESFYRSSFISNSVN
jgi:hypothetical protein